MRVIPAVALLLATFAGFAPCGAFAQETACPSARTVVDIPGCGDLNRTNCQRDLLVRSLEDNNMLVRLGPDAAFDFADFPDLPIHFGRCVTLTSVARFEPGPRPVPRNVSSALSGHSAHGLTHGFRRAPESPGTAAPILPMARSPSSLGPLIKFSENKAGLPESTAVLELACADGRDGEGGRISGFRLLGPSPGNQTTDFVGIRVQGCMDIGISNMEISGWGGSAINVKNSAVVGGLPTSMPKSAGVAIHDNYLHNNQHGSSNGHSAGYGVDIGDGGYAGIEGNLFDWNAHSVTASGHAAGYVAQHNLVLKGGGHHDATFFTYIHVFDAHGTQKGCHLRGDYSCGPDAAGFAIDENAFQYVNSDDIGIRGKPRFPSTIVRNIFAQGSRRDAIDTWTEDAITTENNRYGIDGFGHYQVCDFDGDGVDDLLLATGVSWWLSSSGQFPWTYLGAEHDDPDTLRVGYFDADARCDVLVERPAGSGNWWIASGGEPRLRLLGNFGVALHDAAFGRFDAKLHDFRHNPARQLTHVFRSAQGRWQVKSLAAPESAWAALQSSNIPFERLRFGDFDGDDVTDVLAVVGGHWSYSSSATGRWRTLNRGLDDPVDQLVIANLDADDHIDDILKLERKTTSPGFGIEHTTLTWWRSKNGVEPWKEWQVLVVNRRSADLDTIPVFKGFAGRFVDAFGRGRLSAAFGGATMLIDERRFGHFHGAATTRSEADWMGVFPY